MKVKAIKGSFAGFNSGSIIDCHAHLLTQNRKTTFCPENTGTLQRSFQIEEAQESQLTAQDSILDDATKRSISICSKEDLLLFQKEVNEGNPSYVNGIFQLQCDINLEKELWIPIGCSSDAPFQGIFYGNGHTISNFCVNQKQPLASGFFGYIKNATITDLALLGNVRGNGSAGILAGVSTDSTISNSIVNGKVNGSKYVGLLVGENGGAISNCYAEGSYFLPKLSRSIFLAFAASSALLAFTCSVLIPQPTKDNTYFPPIPVDEKVVRIDNQEPVAGKNSISCDFSTKLNADKKGKVSVNFKNPGSSNQHVVLQLQITDKELLTKLGKTGRKLDEQKQLEKMDSYNPANYRVLVGESGTIPPGYSLKTFDLKKLPDGTVLPSDEYEAIIYLSFYDINSNAEAMLHTQSPVTLIVS